MHNLSKPATLGDVIAWIIGIPVLFSSIFCFKIPFIIPKFVPMFMSLHAKLPAITVFVLSAPGFIWVVIPLAVSVIMVRILLTTSNDKFKVITAVIASTIVWGLIGTVILGIYVPILELQKQLS
jgi:type II secretory pathway component PulF